MSSSFLNEPNPQVEVLSKRLVYEKKSIHWALIELGTECMSDTQTIDSIDYFKRYVKEQQDTYNQTLTELKSIITKPFVTAEGQLIQPSGSDNV